MSGRRQCTAKAKSTGKRCTQPPVIGGKVCNWHGGAARQVREAGKRRAAEQEAQQQVQLLGLRRDIHPAEALLEEVQWTAGHVEWLRGKVQELGVDEGDAGGGGQHALTWGVTGKTIKQATEFPGTDTTEAAEPNIWYQLYLKEREHLVKVAAAALKAGAEERRVQLAEQHGALLAAVVRRVLDDLNLTKKQLEQVPIVVPRAFREIGATP